MRNPVAQEAGRLRDAVGGNYAVRYGRHEKRATFDLKGPFPPGIDVSRHLRRTINGGLFAYRSTQNDCFVDYVRFSNGTTWSRPAR